MKKRLAAVPVGADLLVHIPDPARSALHKRAVSQRRTAAFAAKNRKDLAPAAAVLDVLKDLSPGDIDRAGDAALPGEALDRRFKMLASVPLFFEYEAKCTSRIHSLLLRSGGEPPRAGDELT